MKAEKWDVYEQEYKPHTLPEGATLILNAEDDTPIDCANCGQSLPSSQAYTSLEVHSPMGLGYGVCLECHHDEIKRRVAYQYED